MCVTLAVMRAAATVMRPRITQHIYMQVELARRLRRAYLQNVGILQRRRETLAANLQVRHCTMRRPDPTASRSLHRYEHWTDV